MIINIWLRKTALRRFWRLELLSTTKLSVAEAAEQVGYINQSKFASVFKKQFAFKNLRTIPITSSQMVIAKCIVLLLLSIAFCISSTVASILCGFVFFGVTDILFKVLFSAIYGLLIAISALPLILLIIFFSRSYIFSIMLCVFYSVFNLLSTFSMTALPKWLVLTLPTPSIMLWGTQQMSSRTAINDTARRSPISRRTR